MTRRTSPDRGSTTLTTVLLTPVFVVVAFAAFQAAMWTHARTEARTVARNSAALVARSGEPADAVEASSEDLIRDNIDLRDADVTISADADLVVVTVTGRAPGIIRGTSVEVSVTEAVPVERFRP